MHTAASIHLPGQVWDYIAQEQHLVSEIGEKKTILPKIEQYQPVPHEAFAQHCGQRGILANQDGARLR
jgi:hypothetical protein